MTPTPGAPALVLACVYELTNEAIIESSVTWGYAAFRREFDGQLALVQHRALWRRHQRQSAVSGLV